MIQPNDKGQFCIYKQGTDGEPEGESLKCHPSRRLAQKHLKALYANMRETREMREERRNLQLELRALRTNEDESKSLEFRQQEQEDAMSLLSESLLVDVDGEQVSLESLTVAYRLLKEHEAQHLLQEQKKKTVGGEKFPPGDFLVIEDPESPTTWHLQVKKNGKVDRRLLGAAKAALTSPGGHRGEKYAGPDKASAIRKLKALYKAEGMEFNEADVEEYDGEEPMIVQGPTTFADLIARKSARKAADEIYELTYQFQMLANNVMGSADVADKVAALKALAAEYMTMVEVAMASVQTGAATEESAAEDLAESDSGQAVSLVEVADGPPAVVDVEIIQPGWGNTRDNHYYPADVLARDVAAFRGVKMYATDHRPEQKSVLTEVSTILDIAGFSERGAPIARVGIHNPEFAADVRNRAKLGVLGELHCSILAKGTARDYTKDGRKGKLVESITAVQSVDWVTRAGAGGHAVALVESANEQPDAEGGDPVGVQGQEQEQKIKTEGQASVTESAQVETQPVIISEAAPVAPTEPIAETTPQSIPVTETFLSEADVIAELNKRPALHPAIRIRVGAIPYHDLAEFNAALDREIAYYKQLTGSGSPFAQGTQQNERPMTAKERDARGKERFNRIMREVGSSEV